MHFSRSLRGRAKGDLRGLDPSAQVAQAECLDQGITELLFHWAYGCPEGGGTWLVIPPMPPNRPFEGSSGHLGKVCSLACGNLGNLGSRPFTTMRRMTA